MSRHPPKAIGVAFERTDDTCTLTVSWEFDTFFADNEAPEQYHVRIGAMAVKVVDGEALECKVDGVPLGTLPQTVDVQVCAHWATSGSGAAEDQCALADPLTLPAVTVRPPVPIATPFTPTIQRFNVHPRTLARGAHIDVAWSAAADKCDYVYDSGRNDVVSEETEDRALDFPAASAVTYRFQVRAVNLDFSAGHKKSAWVEASRYVHGHESVRAFLDGADASEGLGRLIRSRGIDAASVRRILHG